MFLFLSSYFLTFFPPTIHPLLFLPFPSSSSSYSIRFLLPRLFPSFPRNVSLSSSFSAFLFFVFSLNFLHPSLLHFLFSLFSFLLYEMCLPFLSHRAFLSSLVLLFSPTLSSSSYPLDLLLPLLLVYLKLKQIKSKSFIAG